MPTRTKKSRFAEALTVLASFKKPMPKSINYKNPIGAPVKNRT